MMKKSLELIGKILLIIGIVLNVLMVFFGIWPSLIYLLLMALGWGILKISQEKATTTNCIKLKKLSSTVSYAFLTVTCLTIIAYFLSRDYLKKNNAINDCKDITEALKRYKNDTGAYPDSLYAITRGFPLRQEWLKDKWNRYYNYKTASDKATYIFMSAGEDGAFYTKDDLIFKGE